MQVIAKLALAAALITACTPMQQATFMPMDAEAFEAASTGSTLYFENSEGKFIGAEQYLANRKTKWQRADGQCLDGAWAQEGENLCFSYSSGKFCYQVGGNEEGAKRFDFVGDNQHSTTLFVTKKDKAPVTC